MKQPNETNLAYLSRLEEWKAIVLTRMIISVLILNIGFIIVASFYMMTH